MFGRGGNEAARASKRRAGKFASSAARPAAAPRQVAEGFINIAVQQMANAIKKISVARGYDVTRYTLQCFGGAGGQHACLVADALGMTRVFVHPLAGVLSAYGMGLADQNVIREQAVEAPLDPRPCPRSRERLDALAAAAQAELRKQQRERRQGHGAPARACALPGHRFGAGGALRRVATSAPCLRVRGGVPAALRLPDAEQGAGRRGRVGRGGGRRRRAATSPATRCTRRAPCRAARRCGCTRRRSGTTPRSCVREDLRPGDVIDGPAIIAEKNATTVVEPGWRGALTALDHLVLERRTPRALRSRSAPGRSRCCWRCSTTCS